MIQSLFSIRLLEEASLKKTFIHLVHPVVKFCVTIFYLVIVISFDRYEVSALLPFALYPVILSAMADIPAWPILKKVLIMEPFIIAVGIMNPFFDANTFSFGTVHISAGWLTFLSLCIKSALTLSSVLLLLATTGINGVGYAMRFFRVPRLFVMQFLLTYRYISVLAEEVARTMTAYSLRSFCKKGLGRSVWGSLPGQILIRSIDRAERLYSAMCLRGYRGEYFHATRQTIGAVDIMYGLFLVAIFAVFRVWNISQFAGTFLGGIIR